ncbi:thioredoxin family protein [Ferdinandcohnia quinoae]|uniref:Thioredoxin family protein n=1 Tax=Fredinandcohnia quinoae TaxID=2918902 RepID=A0AAW5E8R4_9BACI|nr:thioredoxin domain-containing protein [Fredinandcohnia sp. SECRCQ15]MCH1627635.1 thioredoxin family protein [Fredinandcohnia sp. SECRCQ15]
MKKLIIFTVLIVALFAALAIITTVSNKQKAEGNPYGKDELEPATIKQLDDPNYQNQILPDELEKKLEAGESLTVYFYDPTCPHCKETTPVIVPMTNGMGIDLKKFNLLEFRDGWNEYGIESTPTLIHFKNGKEEKRLVGSNEKSVFEEWFLSILGNQ